VFVHEGVHRAMNHHSSDYLPAEKFPTFAYLVGRVGEQNAFRVSVVSFT
jgi:hypothetical protein